jgi:glycerol-3-phosphate dehydrogenase (NAD(P)+)
VIALKRKIAVLGAGKMGTAISQYLARIGRPNVLWARRDSHRQQMATERVNKDYLPTVQLDEAISFSSSLEDALGSADIAVVAIPSSAIEDFLQSIDTSLTAGNRIVVSTVKGLPERGQMKRVSEMLGETFSESVVAVFSGPNIAREVALGLPTTACIACEDKKSARILYDIFNSDQLRVSLTDDLVGTEFCGCLKNVVTIAVGLVDGMGLGENIKGVVVTEGFREIADLVVSSGGQRETLFSPAGLEDLLVASYSGKSRNYLLGRMFGEGYSFGQVRESFGHITFEGVKTAKIAERMCRQFDVDAPVIQWVFDVVQAKKVSEYSFREFWSKIKPGRSLY